ncbi:MAG: FHA domain-containing protein [Armatimonadetes bacterium]|nr:MAG: FHA domain-containing protein [Armatimonadota bacterium]
MKKGMTMPSSGTMRIFRAALSLVVCCFVPTLASAATVRIQLDQERHIVGWVRADLPERIPTAGAEYTAKQFDLPVPQDLKQGWVILHEPETGNVAIAPYSEGTSTYRFGQADWRIGELKLVVKFGDVPLGSGEAELVQEDVKRRAEVKNGEAVFFAVPAGKWTARVRYEGKEKEIETAPVTIDLSLDRSEKSPTLAIGLVDPPKDGQSSAQSDAGAPAKENATSGWANWIVWLVAVVVGGAALAGMYYLLKSNEERVALGMRKLGVSVPSGSSDGGIGGTDLQQPEDGPTATGEPFSAQPSVAPITEGVAPVGAAEKAVEGWSLSGEGVTFSIEPEREYTVGRDPECDLALSDATVSRKHAALRARTDGLFVEDVGSTNGTFVNGRPIEGEVRLQEGDQLQFGKFALRVNRGGASS